MRHLPFRSLAALAFCAAALLIFGIWFCWRPEPPPSPELGSPKLALACLNDSQRTKPLYFNRAALPWLKEHWRDWQAAFGKEAPAPEELAAEFDLGLQSSKVWRASDRKWRFGAVLLTGDPAVFRPLLNSLREAPDWTLISLDPTSYLFVRMEAAGTPRTWNAAADVPSLLAAFDNHSPKERVMARVQIAHRLLFLDDFATARTLLEEAFKLDPKSKEAWTEMAGLEGMSSQWQESYNAAKKALARDGRYRPAKIALVNALYGMRRFEEALDGSRDLYNQRPVDGELLLLHAKVTHAAHAYVEEAEVLHQVISLLQGRSLPIGFWQIYLGQAYSATGDTLQALEQFKNALKDTTLRPNERDFAEKAIERLSARDESMPENMVPTMEGAATK